MTLYFLSGLPRTGTTLLSCILNQNPKIHTSSTSSLLDFLAGVGGVYHEVNQRHLTGNPQQLKNIFRSIFDSYYSHIDCPIIIDKWRGWINNLTQIKEVTSIDPKIIYTYRPIEEIITSFLYLISNDSNNFVDKNLMSMGKKLTNENRAMYLWENGVVGECYSMLETYLNSRSSAEVLFIPYSNLIERTEESLNQIYNLLGTVNFKHNLKEITINPDDNDEYWNLNQLHFVRKKISLDYKNPEDYLDKSTIEFFKSKNNIFNFLK